MGERDGAVVGMKTHERQALALGALMVIIACLLAALIQAHAATQPVQTEPTSEWGQP